MVLHIIETRPRLKGLRRFGGASSLVDPVLTIHIKDGWQVVRLIQGYLHPDSGMRPISSR